MGRVVLTRVCASFVFAWVLCITTLGNAQQTTVDQAIREFEQVDQELNVLWRRARAELPAATFERLLIEQRAWLELRDLIATSFALLDLNLELDDVENSAQLYQGLAYATRERISVIEGWLLPFSGFAADAWTGVWTDGYGGRILIKDDGAGSFVMLIDVARIVSRNVPTGQIGGFGDRNGGRGIVRVSNESDESTPVGAETWVLFHWRPPYLVVETENASSWVGMNASFDGNYIWIRELTSAESSKLTPFANER